MYNYDEKQNLASVVIPTYNRSHYICEVLNSLKNQTYKNIEVIIIDDCSTDNTEHVVKKWNEENNASFTDLIYVKLPRNRDEWWACNIGFYLANGEYIVIQASDDLSHEERIEKQINYLLDNIDVAAVGSSYKVFSGTLDNIIPIPNWLEYDSGIIEKCYKEQFRHCVCNGTMTFRTDILDEIIGYRKCSNNINDYFFISDMVVHNYIVANINKELYYVRYHEGQKTRDLERTGLRNSDYIPDTMRTIKDRVSVILVLDDNSNTVLNTLESISQQSYKNIELIIVDNQLENHMENMVQMWYKSKIMNKNGAIQDFIYFKLPRKVAYSWANNIAAYLAKGEYICFHGENGISDKYRIEKQIEYLKDDLLTSVVGTNFNNSADYIKYDEDIEYSYVMNYMPCINVNTIMLKTDVINETGGLNRKILGKEHFEFIYRLLNRGYRVQNLRDMLYYE
jgi:glycosyltransferase involved in cell wall biosynthesis